jgi:hypothetical protein
VKDIEEQPQQFVTELDKDAILRWYVRKFGPLLLTGHEMRDARMGGEMRYQKQPNGGVFVAEE